MKTYLLYFISVVKRCSLTYPWVQKFLLSSKGRTGSRMEGSLNSRKKDCWIQKAAYTVSIGWHRWTVEAGRLLHISRSSVADGLQSETFGDVVPFLKGNFKSLSGVPVQLFLAMSTAAARSKSSSGWFSQVISPIGYCLREYCSSTDREASWRKWVPCQVFKGKTIYYKKVKLHLFELDVKATAAVAEQGCC